MTRPCPAADMATLANDFVEFARESGYHLDYSEASLATVERIIDAEFGDRRKLGGPWGCMPDYEVAAVQTQTNRQPSLRACATYRS